MEKLDPRIEFERICLLYASAPRIIAGSGLLTVFFSYLLTVFVDVTYVAGWLLIALLVQLPRIVVARSFKKGVEREKITTDNIKVHEIQWVMATIPVSVILSGVVFFPLEGVQLMVIMLFIIILCAGNLVNSSVSLKSVAVDNGILILPAIGKLLVSPEHYTTTVGLIFVVLIVIFSSYALSLNNTIIENITYKINSENLSMFDPLTKLHNRRGMELFIEKMIPRSDRTGKPFSIMIIDVDHFKKYNDTYGHSAGDDVLVSVSEVLLQQVRKDDLVVRYGGEEFMIILPDTRIDSLRHTAGRICEAVKRNTRVTISAGLASYTDKITFENLVDKADKALYEAKQAGRDRYKLAS